ncbi:MAG: tetratricopeptide repeat protein [Janthinobacterium lividum]
MVEEPSRYPLARRRRRGPLRRLSAGLGRGARAIVAHLQNRSAQARRRAGALAILIVAAGVAGWLVHRSHRPDPMAELAMAQATLRQGNQSAAHRHAQTAAAADPRLRAAHVMLARVALVQGDGVLAEGELTRAAAIGGGADPAMLAEARFLQGDADGAIDLAAKAAPGEAAAAGRITARAQAANDDVPAAEATLRRVLARFPGDALAWRDLARIRFDAGDVLGATDAAGRALALAPKATGGDPDLLVLEGEIVRRRYGLAASVPWFRAALAHDAYHVPALLAVAATLGDMGRNAEMLDATRRALAARPGEPRALYLQAVLAARAGQPDLARAMMAHAGGAMDHVPGGLLLNGVLAAEASQWERAIAAWRELVAVQPYDIVARRLLGMALLRSGDPRGALDTLRPVAQRDDADGYTLSLAARAFEATGDRAMAAALLDRAASPLPSTNPQPFGSDDDVSTQRQAVGEDGTDPSRVVELVRSLIEAGRLPEALTLARSLAGAGPGAPEAWRLVGDVQAATNRPADAAVAYARAADLSFDEPTMLRLVSAQAAAGQPIPAARTLALYLAQNPASVPAARMVAGLQVRAGDWPRAIATLERLRAQIGNRDAGLLTQLSAAYLGAGDAAAGQAFGRAAYRLQPMNAATADAYGWASFARADDTMARDLLRKASILAPRDAGIAAHRAAATAPR